MSAAAGSQPAGRVGSALVETGRESPGPKLTSLP
jgi:hypothetical protein